MRLFKLFIPLALFLVLAMQSSAQVVAGFTASPTSGCAPLLVNFTNTTTPVGGTTYSWNFGVSGSSILTNPSTSFTVPGTHVITLTATNGSSVGTFTLAITVYPPPTVSFTANDTTVCPGTPITFTNTSVSGVPGGMTCSWNWGDGSPTTTGSPATHTYGGPGNYTVTLFVTNAQGCQASLTKTAHIHVYTPPVALFSSPGGGCNPPVTIPFTFTGSGTPPLTQVWTWGDSSPPGSGSAPSHSYGAVGTYPVTLVVTDANGCSDTFTQNITISNLTAAFTTDTVCQNGTAVFTNTTTPPFTGSSWNYGDGPGSFPGTPHGSHVYTSPGTYNVTLTVTNGPCTHSVMHPIVVLPNPVVTLTVNPTNPCPAPASITYSGPPGYNYAWTFSPPGTGGSSASGSPATITYPTNGVKNYSVTITDVTTGCISYATGTITIYDIIFNVLAAPTEGCVPLTVNFNTTLYTSIPGPGLSAYPYGPLSGFTWNFGDGGSTTGTGTPTHTYTAIGVYVATVTATTANGCPVTGTVEIHVGAPPQVTFTAAPRHVCYGDYTPVIFTPTVVVGPVDEWVWAFDDGVVITVYDTTNPPNPVSHVYTLPGTFSPTVTPYWRGCPGVPYSITDYIQIDSSKSVIDFTILCTPRKRVNFFNLSLGDDTHLWMFGDATTSTLDNPVHDFPSYGSYTVALATYNAASGCRDTNVVSIYLDSLIPNFTADQTSVCRGTTVNFTAAVVGGIPLDYRWYDNGTLFSGPPTSSFMASRVMTTTGYHTIMLVTRNANNCYDTMRMVNYILVTAPTVGFTLTPVSGCAPLVVTYTSTSTATPGSSLSTFTWTFGDGFLGSGTPTTHTYTAGGTYSVKLKVTDNLGCADSVTQTGAITVWDPTASFVASNVHPCIGGPITFTSTGSGGISSYVWDYGDGTPTGSGASSSHAYNSTGPFTVKLTVTDSHGCTDVATYPAYINVTKPNAAFTLSDSVSVCPPLFVNFTNTSTGATVYNWDFGDGGTSIITSPSNMYIASGLYPVRLIVTNIYGCKDTAIHNVNIFGYAGAMSYSPKQGCAPLTVFFNATLTNVPFITWDFSDGYTSTISYTDTISHTYSTPGAYIPKLLLSDNTGCQTSSVGLDTIKVDGITPKFNTEPSPVCIGMEFTFIDSSTGYWNPPNSWVWTFDGNTSTLQAPTYTINTPGIYPVTLVVSNAWGCTGTITRELIVEPPPIVTASDDTVVCVGDPATLYGYGAVTYTWAEPTPTTLSCVSCNPTLASPPVETMYTVTGTDARGCTDTATVTVRLRTHTEAGAWGDTAVCFGVPVPLFDTGGHTYLWLPATGLSDNTIANPIANPPYTVIYMAIAQLGSCIPDTNYVTVLIHPLPTIDAGPNQRVVAGSSAQITAKGTEIEKLEWWPAESLSCPDCLTPIATMTMNTTYYANVESKYGCKASDSVTILIYCDNSQVFVPNAFTPNGDGQNDVFYPRGIGIKAIRTFRIYNRWGEMIFERENILLNDALNAWDGSYKGGVPKPDVYVYIIEAVCYTGDDVFIKGDVTIIK